MEEQIKLSMEKIEKSLNDNIVKDLVKIKSQIEESKNMQVEKDQVRWADIVKRNVNADEALEKVSSSLNNSAEDFVKFDERERTILMFNKILSNVGKSHYYYVLFIDHP